MRARGQENLVLILPEYSLCGDVGCERNLCVFDKYVCMEVATIVSCLCCWRPLVVQVDEIDSFFLTLSHHSPSLDMWGKDGNSPQQVWVGELAAATTLAAF